MAAAVLVHPRVAPGRRRVKRSGGFAATSRRRFPAGTQVGAPPRATGSPSPSQSQSASPSESEPESGSAFSPASPSSADAPFGRILLKVSGEALAGSLGFGIDPVVVENIAGEVADAVRGGIEVAMVVGGGNFFRGGSAFKNLRIDRTSADYMGMIATVMNALTLQSALEHLGIPSRVQTAIEMKEIAEPYIRRRAIRHLEKGRVVIFGAGTGNPFFTTDTCAALRAAEMSADCLMKATKVDGVYSEDPLKNPNAKLLSHLSFEQVENENKIRVMDKTAVTLCRENNIPIVVFNIKKKGSLSKLVIEKSIDIGTTIT